MGLISNKHRPAQPSYLTKMCMFRNLWDSLVHGSQFLFRILHTSKTSLQAAGPTMSNTPPKTNGWNLKITTVRKGTSSEPKHHFFGGFKFKILVFKGCYVRLGFVSSGDFFYGLGYHGMKITIQTPPFGISYFWVPFSKSACSGRKAKTRETDF